MLLRRDGRGVLAIGQPAHAFISGQLARAWGNERFGAVEPLEEVCLAALQHDVGWSEADLEPAFDAEPGPLLDFIHTPVSLHLRIWRAAPWRLMRQSRYAALLVSMHGTRLYERRDLSQLPEAEAAEVRAYLEEQRALQAELGRALGADEPLTARNSDLVWAWDSLSLALCLGWELRALERVPTADGGHVDIALRREGEHRALLDPWPFRLPALSVRCEGQRLRDRYESEAALREALAEAPWEALTIELRPQPPRSA
jgi:hypothetical protein